MFAAQGCIAFRQDLHAADIFFKQLSSMIWACQALTGPRGHYHMPRQTRTSQPAQANWGVGPGLLFRRPCSPLLSLHAVATTDLADFIRRDGWQPQHDVP